MSYHIVNLCIIVIGNVSACCRFDSWPHKVKLEMLRIVSTFSISGTIMVEGGEGYALIFRLI